MPSNNTRVETTRSPLIIYPWDNPATLPIPRRNGTGESDSNDLSANTSATTMVAATEGAPTSIAESSSASSSVSESSYSSVTDAKQSETIKRLKEEILKRNSSQRRQLISKRRHLPHGGVIDPLRSKDHSNRQNQIDTNNNNNNENNNNNREYMHDDESQSYEMEEDVDMDSEITNTISNNNTYLGRTEASNVTKPIIRDFFTKRYEPRASSVLRPFSSFIGSQQSGRATYEVRVDLKEVDLKKSYICGFLTIHGLTITHPEITTFFKGEIVGPHYSFYTMNEKWGSNAKNDLQHWGRFPSWRNLEFNTENDCENDQIYKNYLNNEFLYMRWKEVFLVPDAEVKDISGASFAGFYYVCFNQLTGSISGLYFHKCSDKFQQLELAHIPDGGCFSSYEYQ